MHARFTFEEKQVFLAELKVKKGGSSILLMAEAVGYALLINRTWINLRR